MIFIFDLDDTIYREEDFFLNGLLSLSKEFSYTLKLSSQHLYNELLSDYKKKGRKKILNRFLKKYKVYNKRNLKYALRIFRLNNLKLSPYPDFLNFIKKTSNEKKYIVTDGHKLVQRRKIKALKIKKKFDKVFISRNFGLKYEKPSLYCFQKIMHLENCNWKDMIYIADNPKKDFVNLNKMGSITVRLLRGNFKNTIPKKKIFEAKYKFKSLNSKLIKLIKKYEKNN